MKLSGENVAALKGCGEGGAVFAKRNSVFRRMWGGERVCKIKIVRFTETFEQRSRLHNAQTVPTHVRKLCRLREGSYAAGEPAKAGKSGSLFAPRGRGLKAEADAKERDSARNRFKQWRPKILRVQGANDGCVVADAR